MEEFLPLALAENLKPYLADQWADFLDSYKRKIRPSIRINRHKTNFNELKNLLALTYPNLEWERIPWTEEGYYYQQAESENIFRPGKSLAYLAGLFYIQEASAMLPAQILKLPSQARVVDLCAAPGGKSIKIASDNRDCQLIANDISLERAMVLLRNVEQCGLENIVVMHEKPENIVKKLAETVDAVILDAPCSGEGMIRRDKNALQAWSIYNQQECSIIQKDLLEDAYKLLKVGGQLLYSTCTFNVYENEVQIIKFLAKHRDMEVVLPEVDRNLEYLSPGLVIKESILEEIWQELTQQELNSDSTNKQSSLAKEDFFSIYKEVQTKARRLWPHCVEGDGHFVILLRKKVEQPPAYSSNFLNENSVTEINHTKLTSNINNSILNSLADFLTNNTFVQTQNIFLTSDEKTDQNNVLTKRPRSYLMVERNYLHYCSWPMETLKGLHILKRGVLLGELKNLSSKMPKSAPKKGGKEPYRKKLKEDSSKNKTETYKLIPSHSLALSRGKSFFVYQLNLKAGDSRLAMYIKGQSIEADKEEIIKHLSAEEKNQALQNLTEGYNPYILILYENFELGLSKWQNGMLKNLYPASWKF